MVSHWKKKKTGSKLYPTETITDAECRWSSTSCKYTCPNRMLAAQTGAGNYIHWFLRQLK